MNDGKPIFNDRLVCPLRYCGHEAVGMVLSDGGSVIWCAAGCVTVRKQINHTARKVFSFTEEGDSHDPA